MRRGSRAIATRQQSLKVDDREMEVSVLFLPFAIRQWVWGSLRGVFFPPGCMSGTYIGWQFDKYPD